jgi:hypothetical protein
VALLLGCRDAAVLLLLVAALPLAAVLQVPAVRLRLPAQHTPPLGRWQPLQGAVLPL